MPVPRRRLWLLLAPLPATAVGLVVARAFGVSWTAYAPNVAGALMGILLFYFYAVQRASSEAFVWMAGVASMAIWVTLLGPSMDGVHRWLALGPLRLNVSAAVAPWLLGGLCAPGGSRTRAAAFVLVAQAAHVVQPDAGQATALAAGAVPLLLGSPQMTRAVRGALAVVVSLAAAAAWLRDDPLPAVEHVERILVLASMKGPAVLTAAVLAGVVLLLPFVALVQGRPRDAVGFALLLYLLASFVVTFVGSFPVPVFGAGAGPVIGWYALLGVRAVLRSVR